MRCRPGSGPASLSNRRHVRCRLPYGLPLDGSKANVSVPKSQNRDQTLIVVAPVPLRVIVLSRAVSSSGRAGDF